MEVRSTPTSRAPSQRQESARFLIDQGELRSILSNLSHELCRPLVSLGPGSTCSWASRQPTITHDQRGHLLTMVSLCDDLLRLTRSYLDYAGIVQGSRPALPRIIHDRSPDRTRSTASSPRSPPARQSTGNRTLRLPDASVVTDASRCQQIFGNLVSNAVKYTPAGGRVRVTGKSEADSWSVIVADSGPGIPAGALDRVFEPFFRLSRDEHSLLEGSGLGLAICRELVAQLQGEISLSARSPGEVRSISVRFPLATTGVAAVRPNCAAGPGKSRPGLLRASGNLDPGSANWIVRRRRRPRRRPTYRVRH